MLLFDLGEGSRPDVDFVEVFEPLGSAVAECLSGLRLGFFGTCCILLASSAGCGPWFCGFSTVHLNRDCGMLSHLDGSEVASSADCSP
ncbi:hypothetical protein Nepgr_030902 [Nepenthes gracilis]|uniref:Uncharacterized protein n=1 Tax=Nepenthes gracilis TaxID=150966 RepID=A0AAD3THA1_NEPGR|nr:hypothetical protein Nepgr_030902 [Nepenthes gracilis]